jgi:hypothetical protein
MNYTKEECKEWMENKNRNPKTNRKIKTNGPTYKKIEKSCNNIENIKKKSEKKNKKQNNIKNIKKKIKKKHLKKNKELFDLLEDVEQYIKDKKLNKKIRFKPNNINSLSLLLNLLKRAKNDCLVIDIGKNSNVVNDTDINIYENGKISLGNMTEKKFFDEIDRCKKNNYFVVIPVGFTKIHQNMIIYNPYTDTYEHYEPHGRMFGNLDLRTISRMYRSLRNFFTKNNSKYILPAKTCPYSLGLQSIEQQDKSKGEFRDGVYIKDPEGFCVIWSYYLAELRLKYPKLYPEEIYKKAMENTGETSEKMRQFVRAYSRLFLKELKKSYKYYKLIMDPKLDPIEYVDIINQYNKYIKKRFKKFICKTRNC